MTGVQNMPSNRRQGQYYSSIFLQEIIIYPPKNPPKVIKDKIVAKSTTQSPKNNSYPS